jgi:hypothetical protein
MFPVRYELNSYINLLRNLCHVGCVGTDSSNPELGKHLSICLKTVKPRKRKRNSVSTSKKAINFAGEWQKLRENCMYT